MARAVSISALVDTKAATRTSGCHLRQVEQEVRRGLGAAGTVFHRELVAPASHDAPECSLFVAQPEISRAHRRRQLVPTTQPSRRRVAPQRPSVAWASRTRPSPRESWGSVVSIYGGVRLWAGGHVCWVEPTIPQERQQPGVYEQPVTRALGSRPDAAARDSSPESASSVLRACDVP